MIELVTFMGNNIAMIWLILGLLLLVGEMVVPGIYLLWLGGAAVLTASFTYFAGDLTFLTSVIVFVGTSVAAILLANRTAYAKAQIPGEGIVNLRGNQHVGRRYEVVEAIKNGRGRIKVGDSQWSAEGPDCAVGEMVEVVSVDGACMLVEPVRQAASA